MELLYRCPYDRNDKYSGGLINLLLLLTTLASLYSYSTISPSQILVLSYALRVFNLGYSF